MVAATLPWAQYATTATAYPQTVLNLLAQFNSGQFTDIQTVYVDNSTCPFAVRIVCAETLFTITVPPFSLGMFPLLVEAAPQFTVSLPLAPQTGGGTSGLIAYGTTRLYFLNIAYPPYEARSESFNDFQASTTNNPNFNGALVIMPVLPTTQHYAISSLLFTITTAGSFAFSGTRTFWLRDRLGYTLFQDQFDASTTPSGIMYNRQVTFPAPIVVPADASGIFASLDTFPTGGNTTLSFTINYGIVVVS